MNSPMYLEDFHPGDVRELRSRRTITREEIIAFAREFDPQPFHLDEDAAKRSPFGGLIASGWHTTALVMRMVVDELISPDANSFGSPGADEIRWLKPVRPGDTLRLRMTVADVTPSTKKPDRGTVRFAYEVLNQHDEKVMTMIGMGIIRRRPT